MTTLTEETTRSTFTAADRCDACGAQAYVRVDMEAGQLMFCAHHARKFSSKISEVALSVIDETEMVAR
ncbi:hypothetical protein EBF03_03735 [Arcanobacterium haemolyticum]|uniref:DUF7455 domain-containing protein n=1 Tax=Arcanobacterium haemolyticum (strain ATCC 9345 / DSM 20595 / CCM 5947 / CCUG 17215 / LMG 16163 / NBRC 15585 / NCTC 8452 / 11018) TaxID=644284 RepID=D7BNJ5_ARCHD|nr:hypothetical protein [Arcanobacterium haemolyticum]ADH92494.1 conserved hypothetical protein [Arcanobacterium haemolyticum DSM 20595]QCX46620.1 hypothetical protein EBF03_03735 [Arcanobacterium haemolyticum]SPT75036.1 Uncharacterised protein [Arcanobacterium haemolyticum]SQH28776.1 Uncharacterised protein [Arcanobacterium haemolyticum]